MDPSSTEKKEPSPLNAGIVLKRSISDIMDKWEQEVRANIPPAKTISVEFLQNAVKIFLNRIADFISTTNSSQGGERFSEEVLEPAKSHGAQRASDFRYSLDYVIHEYRILRRVIFEVVEAEHPLSDKEREKLMEAIDHGLVQAVKEFALGRGFQAKLLSEAEAQTKDAQRNLKEAQTKIDELQVERSLRERFVSALSHDLRTPLTAVRAGAELITRRAENIDFVRRLAARIAESSDRIDRMIRDLLDANRIEAGERVSLKFQKCNLALLATDLLENLETVHGDRFCLEADSELTGFWSPDDLQRVIENLLINGLKYGNPHEKVNLILSEQSETVTLKVHNQGNPIPLEQQKILFQPFKRLLSAQMGGKGGWGLGLVLAKGIIEAHHGRIEVESQPDSGTTFTIVLPKDSRDSSTSRAA